MSPAPPPLYERRHIPDRRVGAVEAAWERVSTSLLGRLVTNPRVLLVTLVIVNGVAATVTADNPPEYLAYPWIWSAVAALACVACAISVARVTRGLVAAAGAFTTTAMALRGLWLLIAVIADEPGERSTNTQGGVVWLTLAVLVYAVWLLSIQPWAAAKSPAR